jgi:SAM-dependent methyltransferase
LRLREREDAYGQLILAYLQEGHAIEVVERDDGFLDASDYNPAAYFAPYRRWPAAERKAIRYARGRVLDIGCGAGRVALHLQERGHDVVAIDLSPLAVDVSRKRGVHDVRELSITQIGPKLGEFETVVMFGNNFGLFGSPKRARWLLRRLRSVANDRARVLAESRDPYTGSTPAHLAYHERNRRRGRMPGALRIRIRHQLYATPWFDYLIVSPDEMEHIVDGTGWRLAEVIDEGEVVYIGVLEPT